MKQKKVDRWERKITKDRNSNFRGTACVDLDILDFSKGPSREENKKIVNELKEKFKKGGIYRLEPKNYVSATIEIEHLSTALELSGVSAEDLIDNPKETPPRLTFPPGFRLSGRHGLQRIAAAKEVLRKQSQRWWTVRLYIEGTL
jgi:Protein of unknown function (DUF3723)